MTNKARLRLGGGSYFCQIKQYSKVTAKQKNDTLKLKIDTLKAFMH